MTIIRQIPWINKPPVGTKINLSHPMAKDLFFFCALDSPRDQIDLASNRIGAFVDTSGTQVSTRVATPEGIVVDIDQASSESGGFDFGDSGGSGVYEPTELTICVRADTENEVATGGARVISKRTAAGGSDDWAIYLNSTTAMRFRINGSDDEVVKGTGDWLNKRLHLALAVDSSGQDNYVWDLDGVIQTLLAQTGATVNQSTGNLTIGHRQAEQRTWDGKIHWIALFNRKKSSVFIETFRKNPWQIFQPLTQIIPIEVAAPVGGRIMSSLAYSGGLAHKGGIAGKGGGLAG